MALIMAHSKAIWLVAWDVNNKLLPASLQSGFRGAKRSAISERHDFNALYARDKDEKNVA
jgi:hypothetical protein